MGIHGLWKYIEKYCEEHEPKTPAYVNVDLDVLRGKKTAIDLMGPLYRFVDEINKNRHLYKLLELLEELLRLKADVIFVLDGDSNPLKKEENRIRSQTRNKQTSDINGAVEQIKQHKIDQGLHYEVDAKTNLSLQPGLFDDEESRERLIELHKQENRLHAAAEKISHVKIFHKEQAAKLIQAFGFPLIYAVDDGEADCSKMNSLGAVDYVLTEDSDALPYGAKSVIRFQGSKDGQARAYDIPMLTKRLGLTRFKMIEVCILCENDYNKTTHVKGIGPDRAYKGIQKFGDAESFLSDHMENRIKKATKVKRGEKPKHVDTSSIISEYPSEEQLEQVRNVFMSVLTSTQFDTSVVEQLEKLNALRFITPNTKPIDVSTITRTTDDLIAIFELLWKTFELPVKWDQLIGLLNAWYPKWGELADCLLGSNDSAKNLNWDRIRRMKDWFDNSFESWKVGGTVKQGEPISSPKKRPLPTGYDYIKEEPESVEDDIEQEKPESVEGYVPPPPVGLKEESPQTDAPKVPNLFNQWKKQKLTSNLDD